MQSESFRSFASELKDPRGIILYAMKQTRDNLKQHINYLPDCPEKDAILAARASRDNEKKLGLQAEVDEEARRIHNAESKQRGGCSGSSGDVTNDG